ncbi:MAG: hypothetical protein E6J20_20985 [Chloroflexi bacterium]|nr:MAG: hypothetical protein E6J20_20985 [Chloroflexota bacterium]
MRILAVSNLYPPDILGGYEIRCRRTVEWLRARGHEVEVVTSVPLVPVAGEPGVTRGMEQAGWIARRPWRGPLDDVDAAIVNAANVRVFLERVEATRPDVVQLWNLLGIGGAALVAAVHQLGLPWVWMLGDQVPRQLCMIEHRVIPVLSAALTEILAEGRHVACSRGVVAEIEEGDGPKLGGRIEVLPNWVVGQRPPARGRHYAGGPLRCAFAGAVAEHKGVDVIVAAVAELRRRGIEGVSVDVFGLPTSPREPFGIAALEAASRECVPLVTESCGYAEWFTGGVDCLTAPRDPGAVADVIAGVVAGRIQLGPIARCGADTVWRDFHIDAVLPRVEAILAEEAAAPRRREPLPAPTIHRMALAAADLAERLLRASA